jgi:hypothetical protein
MSEAAAPAASNKKIVLAITEKGDKSYFTKVGVGFPNRDGSWTLRLDAMPLSGTLMMRDEDAGGYRRPGGGQ